MFDKDLWQEAKKQIVPLMGAILFGALLGVTIVAQAWLLSRVISDVFLYDGTLAEQQQALVWLVIVILLRAGFVFLRGVSAGKVSIRVRSGLRKKLFGQIIRASPMALSGERTGELANTILEGIDRLDAYFRAYLPQLGMAAIVPALVLLVVFPLDWLTGIIFVLTAPLIPLFMVLIGKEAEKRTDRQWKLLGRLNGHFLDVLQGLQTLKAFGLSKRQGRVIQSVSEEYASVTLGVLRIAFLSALTLELLATISTAVVAVQIGLRLMYGRIDFASSLFILILAPEFYFPLRQLGAAFHAGMDGVAAAGQIFGFLNMDEEELESRKTEIISGAEIRFENVRFAYQDGDRPSLRGVSFSIPEGKHTALVGASGAGKSTIFSLLLGFIELNEGEIWIGDTSISQISLADWRNKVSWVPQFPYLFHDTVLNNLRLARPNASEAEIFEATRKANADEFIRSLPEGYETIIGDRGTRLSGGQAQRLAIARAFLRDAALVLMDEPASSLDLANERAIRKAVSELREGRTVVTISHRIGTIKDADQIVVLDKGVVRQADAHAELFAEDGQFKDLLRGRHR